MKDHEIAQLVDALCDCAVEFRDAQQLRARIAALVVPALRGARSPDAHLADVAVNYLTEIGRANKGIRRLRRKLDRALEDIDDLSGACSIAWAAAAKAEPLRAPTPQDCVDIAEWHKSECEACRINPSESEDYGRAMVDAVRLVLVDGAAAALQQSSSGITAGAEKPSQVVDSGAAGPIRTGDLLITNQNEKAPETSQNQDVTPKTAPTQPAQVASTESSGCEGVTADQLPELVDRYQLWVDQAWNGRRADDGNALRHLFIMSLGLGGESGEVQELLKKHVRDGVLDKHKLLLELGDVAYYLTRIASWFGMSLRQVLEANQAKITERQARGKFGASS